MFVFFCKVYLTKSVETMKIKHFFTFSPFLLSEIVGRGSVLFASKNLDKPILDDYTVQNI